MADEFLKCPHCKRDFLVTKPGKYVLICGTTVLVKFVATIVPGRPAFECPVCHYKSSNPHDIAEGYCGKCHKWTGEV